MSCRCGPRARPVVRHGVMGRGHVFCGNCGADIDPEQWTIKSEHVDGLSGQAIPVPVDPYLPPRREGDSL